MGRLDELDLSLKLSDEEEAERLQAGWKRLAGLRLALGGKLPGYVLGYLDAIVDMLARTDHDPSPWYLVEGESKKYARVKVVETVIERIERGMREQQLEPPAFGG
jgi:hypothetical protein